MTEIARRPGMWVNGRPFSDYICETINEQTRADAANALAGEMDANYDDDPGRWDAIIERVDLARRRECPFEPPP